MLTRPSGKRPNGRDLKPQDHDHDQGHDLKAKTRD